MKQYSFTRKERLKKNRLIKDVFDNGVSLKGRFIKVFLLKRTSGPKVSRVAFISKKSLYNKSHILKGKGQGKNIVLRNRFRRLLREAYRKTKHLLPHTYDIVILATHIKRNTKSFIVEEDLANVFKKCSKK